MINAAASEGGQEEAVVGELEELIDDVWRDQPEFARLLASPLISQQDKDRILVEAFEGRALPVLLRFLRVLNMHGRLALLPAVAQQARALLDRRQNRFPVTVRSAVPLEQDQLDRLQQSLTQLTGASAAVLNLEIDPSLIGGLVVQVGDHVYDASVRNRLDKMRKQLVEAKTRELQGRREVFSSAS